MRFALASLAGASVVAFMGKLAFAVVLGAIALGFFLRLTNRRKTGAANSPPPATPMWCRALVLVLSAAEVAALVEATNLPVRFDQQGFASWHWLLVVGVLFAAYHFQLQGVRSILRRRARAISNQ